MIGNYSARLTGSNRNLLALLASSVIFSAGCANMSTTAPASNPLSTPPPSAERFTAEISQSLVPLSVSGTPARMVIPALPRHLGQQPPQTAQALFPSRKTSPSAIPPRLLPRPIHIPALRPPIRWSMSSPRGATPRTMEILPRPIPPLRSWLSTATAGPSIPRTSSL